MDLRQRDALIELHIHWAREIAARVAAMLPPCWTPDDLAGPAEEALLRAAAEYDPRRGVPFRAYAVQRVYGACFDASRRRHYRAVIHESLETVRTIAAAGPLPDEQADLQRQAYRLWRQLYRLPMRHHRVIDLRYRAGWSVAEIGEALGVTAGRVSQIHGEAIEMLRAFRMRGGKQIEADL